MTQTNYDENNKQQIPSVSIHSNETLQNISTISNIFILNDDCMRKIFEYCSVADLYNICIASDELKITVLQNAVKGRLIDFSDLADCCHILGVFKMFGQYMTKISIGEKDIQYKERKFSKFDEILRLISTYCSNDTLKQLNLEYYYGTVIKKRFLYASLPSFHCIESLTISEIDHHGTEDCINYFNGNSEYNRSVNKLLERIVGNASNIHSIQLRNLRITGRFFYLDQVHNLKTLTLDGCNIRVPEGFLSFLQEKPTLKSFTWHNSSLRGLDTPTSHSSNLVFELVADNLPDLEAFDYYPNEGFINENNKYVDDCLFIFPNYDSLSKFNKLKVLSLPGVTVECLQILSRKNTVQKLLTGFSKTTTKSIDLNFLHNFSSLKSIQLYTSFLLDVKSFNKELLSKLRHLTECYLSFHKLDDDDVIIEAVTSARNLSNLHISWRSGGFPIALYMKLLEIRSEKGLLSKPLVIYTDKELRLAEFLSNLGPNYKPNIITLRAAI